MTAVPYIEPSFVTVATLQLAAIDELAKKVTEQFDATADVEMGRFALSCRVTAANLAVALDDHVPDRAHTDRLRDLQFLREAEARQRERSHTHRVGDFGLGAP